MWWSWVREQHFVLSTIIPDVYVYVYVWLPGDRGEQGDKGAKGYGIPGYTGDQGPNGNKI